MSSVRARQFRVTPKSSIFYPFVDSLIYKTTPLEITNKIRKYVIDYTYTINGYVAIIFTLLQKKNNVYIENREIITNLPGKFPLNERSTNVKLNNFLAQLNTYDDLLVIMPKREKNDWIDQLIKSPTLTEESKALLEQGVKNNVYPSRFYKKDPSEEQYIKYRFQILKHLNVKINEIPRALFLIVDFEIDPSDFPEMKNYNEIINKYGNAKRLYYLCKRLNLNLIV